ncbi:MAG TPA: tRNA (adenosine(37)-N6)-threonylcarbamoyltransferase complex ATPase subunit type 1 TsaE [Halanaerobiaceae bacterium]|jgi:tRNA threonylcarbamoyladenosine biosynthesis protein TsaE|nr:tRNA (adenosine(37)-N6)-threonylcarbamoyltransferase complex ATPase subunit type 1 TsaE [Bacillota bacterium]HHU92674.1 tRNA (adenosine(37)-N6)-threonylcarbamoyltransferase complex ATPase subunit type 1 TsaE [Halanaerobiaceae bacterium]HOA41064.1 tRNA (adenosine(37)-N6)-threonylcarbamoyltransferase complex ATPase subunit type 1 TsaE [Halanaerobiales bacterium]HPZ63183.1 tRNA (adenosine(37)-N6)-threonylcarbamoyltransferase complex ATPase subunit type 1 TsaE [Halanaerobiales bacterium]HQD04285
MDDNLTFISSSEEETYSLGETIGELVEAGQIILLSGDLGAGKTVLAQGICAGLGVLEDVTSPTFNLINEYEGDLTVYHMDLYRLEKEEELYDLAIEEYLESDGVVIIEWPDLVYDLLPPDFIYIKINTLAEEEREISLEGEGENSLTLLERLEEYVDFRY